MTLRMKLNTAATLTLLVAPAFAAHAFPLLGKKKPATQQEVRKLTPAQSALVDKSIVREKAIVESLKKRTPLVETYIQNMKPDPVMGATVDTDNHFLGRVDFGKVIDDKAYGSEKRDSKGKESIGSKFKNSLSYITHLSTSLHLTYHESGFVQMLLIDSKDFNRQMYTFSYYKGGFLGSVPVVIFDVQPSKKGSIGRFAGRIYVDKTSGNIVRFNGSFSGGQQDITEYYHFDSWRTNVQEGLWLPYSVYIEETDAKDPEHTLKFKAMNYIWGYSLKVPQADSTEADISFTSDVADAPQSNLDTSPLQAQRQWVQQAEDNVIDRLFQAGLIDAPSQIEKDLLEPLANLILQDNNIVTDRPIKVRVLLTQPLESLAVGNTILISRGLLDTTATLKVDTSKTPVQYSHDAQYGNLNAILAFQDAHIVLGHHIDTKYAFSDRLLFPSESAFQRLPMYHTDVDNVAAAKKALEWLQNDKLADGQQYFSLYLQQLQVRLKGLKALNTPQIGDSLLKPDGSFWMQAIISKGPKLNNADLNQRAALPLGSDVKYDSWTDKVSEMQAPVDLLLSPRDKYPFEILPVPQSLSYYTAPAAPTTAPEAPAADGTAAPAGAAAADGTAPATPAATTPAETAATTGTSTPPADTTAAQTTTPPR